LPPAFRIAALPSSDRHRHKENFGLVSGFFRNTGLLKELDRLIPKSKEHKISHGQVILAMVMNMLKVGTTFGERADEKNTVPVVTYEAASMQRRGVRRRVPI